MCMLLVAVAVLDLFDDAQCCECANVAKHVNRLDQDTRRARRAHRRDYAIKEA